MCPRLQQQKARVTFVKRVLRAETVGLRKMEAGFRFRCKRFASSAAARSQAHQGPISRFRVQKDNGGGRGGWVVSVFEKSGVFIPLRPASAITQAMGYGRLLPGLRRSTRYSTNGEFWTLERRKLAEIIQCY